MEKLIFLKRFLKSPRSIGSITPSSKRLARSIVYHAQLSEPSLVVEFGAGAGVITKEILDSVPLKHPLMIFESDPSMRDFLLHHKNTVLYDDAFQLINRLESYKKQVDVIFSGLPLFNFSEEQIISLLQQVHDLLKPGGKLIGFQYTPFLFFSLKQVFNKTSLTFVPINIPPTLGRHMAWKQKGFGFSP